MGKNGYIFKSLLSAAGVVLYTSRLVWVIFNGKNLFSKAEIFVVPLFILHVISASITGALVPDRPVMLYLDGRKKDAIVSLLTTVG